MQPLAEVFGFPICNVDSEAARFRKSRLCPFNNKVPSCTKDKAKNPLGVCSVLAGEKPVITCPVRFRESWLIAEDAAGFFFKRSDNWTSLAEVTLSDKDGKTAGHIDLVLVSYDKTGKIVDFGSLEIQAVYISGNIRAPFEYYSENPSKRMNFDWHGQPNYPKPDFLSSFRKCLIPQIIYKGAILRSWGKKTAIAVDTSFFSTLPKLDEVTPAEADMVWLVYSLRFDRVTNRYTLYLDKTVCTNVDALVETAKELSIPRAGSYETFIGKLEAELDRDWGY